MRFSPSTTSLPSTETSSSSSSSSYRPPSRPPALRRYSSSLSLSSLSRSKTRVKEPEPPLPEPMYAPHPAAMAADTWPTMADVTTQLKHSHPVGPAANIVGADQYADKIAAMRATLRNSSVDSSVCSASTTSSNGSGSTNGSSRQRVSVAPALSSPPPPSPPIAAPPPRVQSQSASAQSAAPPSPPRAAFSAQATTTSHSTAGPSNPSPPHTPNYPSTMMASRRAPPPPLRLVTDPIPQRPYLGGLAVAAARSVDSLLPMPTVVLHPPDDELDTTPVALYPRASGESFGGPARLIGEADAMPPVNGDGAPHQPTQPAVPQKDSNPMSFTTPTPPFARRFSGNGDITMPKRAGDLQDRTQQRRSHFDEEFHSLMRDLPNPDEIDAAPAPPPPSAPKNAVAKAVAAVAAVTPKTPKAPLPQNEKTKAAPENPKAGRRRTLSLSALFSRKSKKHDAKHEDVPPVPALPKQTSAPAPPPAEPATPVAAAPGKEEKQSRRKTLTNRVSLSNLSNLFTAPGPDKNVRRTQSKPNLRGAKADVLPPLPASAKANVAAAKAAASTQPTASAPKLDSAATATAAGWPAEKPTPMESAAPATAATAAGWPAESPKPLEVAKPPTVVPDALAALTGKKASPPQPKVEIVPDVFAAFETSPSHFEKEVPVITVPRSMASPVSPSDPNASFRKSSALGYSKARDANGNTTAPPTTEASASRTLRKQASTPAFGSHSRDASGTSSVGSESRKSLKAESKTDKKDKRKSLGKRISMSALNMFGKKPKDDVPALPAMPAQFSQPPELPETKTAAFKVPEIQTPSTPDVAKFPTQLAAGAAKPQTFNVPRKPPSPKEFKVGRVPPPRERASSVTASDKPAASAASATQPSAQDKAAAAKPKPTVDTSFARKADKWSPGTPTGPMKMPEATVGGTPVSLKRATMPAVVSQRLASTNTGAAGPTGPKFVMRMPEPASPASAPTSPTKPKGRTEPTELAYAIPSPPRPSSSVAAQDEPPASPTRRSPRNGTAMLDDDIMSGMAFKATAPLRVEKKNKGSPVAPAPLTLVRESMAAPIVAVSPADDDDDAVEIILPEKETRNRESNGTMTPEPPSPAPSVVSMTEIHNAEVKTASRSHLSMSHVGVLGNTAATEATFAAIAEADAATESSNLGESGPATPTGANTPTPLDLESTPKATAPASRNSSVPQSEDAAVPAAVELDAKLASAGTVANPTVAKSAAPERPRTPEAERLRRAKSMTNVGGGIAVDRVERSQTISAPKGPRAQKTGPADQLPASTGPTSFFWSARATMASAASSVASAVSGALSNSTLGDLPPRLGGQLRWPSAASVPLPESPPQPDIEPASVPLPPATPAEKMFLSSPPNYTPPAAPPLTLDDAEPLPDTTSKTPKRQSRVPTALAKSAARMRSSSQPGNDRARVGGALSPTLPTAPLSAGSGSPLLSSTALPMLGQRAPSPITVSGARSVSLPSPAAETPPDSPLALGLSTPWVVPLPDNERSRSPLVEESNTARPRSHRRRSSGITSALSAAGLAGYARPEMSVNTMVQNRNTTARFQPQSRQSIPIVMDYSDAPSSPSASSVSVSTYSYTGRNRSRSRLSNSTAASSGDEVWVDADDGSASASPGTPMFTLRSTPESEYADLPTGTSLTGQPLTTEPGDLSFDSSAESAEELAPTPGSSTPTPADPDMSLTSSLDESSSEDGLASPCTPRTPDLDALVAPSPNSPSPALRAAGKQQPAQQQGARAYRPLHYGVSEVAAN